jgi:multidrug efflux pump subunit AcrA (membrane-fusion protein)
VTTTALPDAVRVAALGVESEGPRFASTALADLLPAGATGGALPADGAVRLTPGEVATFGITFGSAEVRPLFRTVRAVGLVEFDETRMVYVSPKFGGWAERLYVDFTGQSVREGQPLLDVSVRSRIRPGGRSWRVWPRARPPSANSPSPSA